MRVCSCMFVCVCVRVFFLLEICSSFSLLELLEATRGKFQREGFEHVWVFLSV